MIEYTVVTDRKGCVLCSYSEDVEVAHYYAAKSVFEDAAKPSVMLVVAHSTESYEQAHQYAIGHMEALYDIAAKAKRKLREA